MTHTPGPWIAQRDLRHSTNEGTLHDSSPKAWGVYGQYRVANVCESIGVQWDSDTEAESNARLIAAAPDLYDALRAILFQTAQGSVLERDACITQARAAMAKAQA